MRPLTATLAIVTLLLSQACSDSVTFHEVNAAPFSRAGSDAYIPIGVAASLDGSASSDPDGDILSYRWEVVSLPAGSSAALSDPATASPVFTPDVKGDYVFALTVDDLKNLSNSTNTDTVVLTTNYSPVTLAGKDGDVTSGTTVTLDGSSSSDPDGDPLTYKWELTSRPAGSLAAIDGSSNPETALATDVDGEYVISLTVDDRKGLSNSAIVDEVRIFAYTTFSFPESPDHYENDSSAASAGAIEEGEAQWRSIYPAGDRDWIRVTLRAGVTFEFRSSHLSVNGDTYLNLYDSDGTTVLGFNDDCIGFDSCLRFTPETDGDYFLVVNAFETRGVTSYLLEVEPYVDSDGDYWSPTYDCNDGDPGISPSAKDIAGDGIDQNCNGVDALVKDVADRFEPDDDEASATPIAVAQGMQYEVNLRDEFFPGAVHTIDWPGDFDYFSVVIPPHQIVSVSNLGMIWPLNDEDLNSEPFLLLTPGLRASYNVNYYLPIANDSDEPVTAVLVVGMSTIRSYFSYILYAVPMGYDYDMDGFGTMGMWGEYDCDDSDPTVYEGNFEIPGDGIDQDCSGADLPLGAAVGSAPQGKYKKSPLAQR